MDLPSETPAKIDDPSASRLYVPLHVYAASRVRHHFKMAQGDRRAQSMGLIGLKNILHGKAGAVMDM